MKRILFSIIVIMATMSSRAQVVKNPQFTEPDAPFTFINVIEMSEESADKFIADWKTRSEAMGQQDGYITGTLYQSVLPDFQYRMVDIALWQSYDAWVAANNNPVYAGQLSEDLSHTPDIKQDYGFYRPVNFTVNTTNNYPPGNNRNLDTRVRKDPAFPDPGEPFVFINLMEMTGDDAVKFIADSRERSKIMGQQQGAIGATLYRSVLPDGKFRIVNVSQWQSYDAFINANNQPVYSSQLTSDLSHTPSIKLNRGFYRPAATYTHLYE